VTGKANWTLTCHRELLGEDWSHEMSAAWRPLIAEIESEVAESGV
jgi:hypothetical protein